MRKTSFLAIFSIFCLTLVFCHNKKADEPKLNLENLNLALLITEDYFEIWASGGALPKIFYKEDGANLWVHNKESEKDTGMVEQRSAYDELEDFFVKIHERFKDFADVDKIIIVPESDVLFSKSGEEKIINATRKAVDSGFFQVAPAVWENDSQKEQDKFHEQLEKILKKVSGLKLEEKASIGFRDY